MWWTWTLHQIKDFQLPKPGETMHYCECRGEGEVGKGLPIVLVPGYAGGVGVFYRMLKFLIARWAGAIYVLDLPGQGCSERRERFFRGPEEVEHFFAKRMKYWLDAVIGSDKKVVIVAHSFGGYCMTAFADLHKENIAGLILLSPCFGFPKSRMPNEEEKGVREKFIVEIFGFKISMWSTFFTRIVRQGLSNLDVFREGGGGITRRSRH